MANPTKGAFLAELTRRYGEIIRIGNSQSLYSVAGDALRVYVRYSRIHGTDRTFYGLREEDVRMLEGHNAILCFLWDGQAEPLFVPFEDYEHLLYATAAASDGQFKAQVYLREAATELYIAQSGRYNVDAYFGWALLNDRLADAAISQPPQLSHAQVQTLLGAIGAKKGYGVWIPAADRARLDWGLTSVYPLASTLPAAYEQAARVLAEIDVIWVKPGTSQLEALYEVEHTTSVYSGLLRFNDVLVLAPQTRPRFGIVSSSSRRDLFARQVTRPTFRASGLEDLCAFLDYGNVYRWFRRTAQPI